MRMHNIKTKEKCKMTKLILAMIIACSLIVGGCTSTESTDDTEPTTKVEEKDVSESEHEETKEEKSEAKPSDKTETKAKKKKEANVIIGVCYDCGVDIYSNDFKYSYGDGRYLCKKCYNTCDECGQSFNGNDACIIQPGHMRICPNCYEKELEEEREMNKTVRDAIMREQQELEQTPKEKDDYYKPDEFDYPNGGLFNDTDDYSD